MTFSEMLARICPFHARPPQLEKKLADSNSGFTITLPFRSLRSPVIISPGCDYRLGVPFSTKYIICDKHL